MLNRWTIFIVGVTLAAVFHCVSATGDDTMLEKAHEHLERIIYSDKAERFEARLGNIGLENSEIQSRIDKASSGYATCMVEFFASRPEKGFKDILNDLAMGNAELDLGPDDEAADTEIADALIANTDVIEACVQRVHDYLGIPGAPIL